MTHPHTQNIVIRLAKIEEHAQAASRMIREGAPRPIVLRHLAAIRSASNEVAKLIVRDHVDQCVTGVDLSEHLEAELDSLLAALDLLI